MGQRHNFTALTRQELAERAGHTCAYPGCGLITTMAAIGHAGAIRLSRASHNVAAAPNGPRPNSEHGLTSEQIRAAENGIWTCPTCADVIDRDTVVHDVETLRRWQHEAEVRRNRQHPYGRSLGVNASPHEVGARAQSFVHEVRHVLPSIQPRFQPDVRVDCIQRIRGFLGSMHPFIPTNALHGLEPELVNLQNQILEDLRTFISFVEDPCNYWRSDFSYIPSDRNCEGATVVFADQLIVRLGRMINRVSERWGQGHGYYSGWD